MSVFGKTIKVDEVTAMGSEFVNTDMWNQFLDFLEERQRIWYKKEILKEPEPWTSDEVLRQAKIINVYRELDRNSRYEIEHIVRKYSQEPVEQIRRIVLFRHTNSRWIYESLTGGISEEDFKKQYAAENEKGNGVSRAMLFNTPRGMSYPDWVWKFYVWLESNLALLDRMQVADSPKKLFDLIDGMPHIGEFFAYEMYTSFTYCDWCPFTEDDLLVVGPGAIPGLETILGLPKWTLYSKESEWLVRHCAPLIRDRLLTRSDYVWIPEMYQPKNPQQFKFTLRVLEHSLCEFRKYWSIKNGLTGIRRRRSF